MLFRVEKMNKPKRSTYSAEFKAKVALQAVRGKLTVNEIAKEFAVHPNQVTNWKKQLLDSVTNLFADGRAAKAESEQSEQLQAHLYQQIGQLKVELDWLKKKSCPGQLKFGAQWSSRRASGSTLNGNVNCSD